MQDIFKLITQGQRSRIYRFWNLTLLFIISLGSYGWLSLYGSFTLTPKPNLLQEVSFSQTIFDRQGQLMRLTLSADGQYRIYTPLKELSAQAIAMTLQYEDKYFYHHPGINPWSLVRGMLSLWGSRRIGGSTLTMQVARLRYKLSTTTLSGKLQQIYTSLLLEHYYSKDEILEAYFNLAPYGGNIQGLAAASRIYFHKTPNRLTSTESLALTLIPQNPNQRNPITGSDFNLARTRLTNSPTFTNFQSSHFTPDPKLKVLGKEGVWGRENPSPEGFPFPSLSSYPNLPPLRLYAPTQLPFIAPHLSNELLLLPKTSHTYIDTPVQKRFEEIVQNFAKRGQRYGLNNAATLLVHWPSMEVRALIGSANFFDQQISGQVDGTKARRSPGSTLKPFIYALAMEQGLIHAGSVLLDSPRSFGGYDPKNSDQSFKGPLPAWQALQLSRNVPAISLASQLKYPKLYDFLLRAGVGLSKSEEHYGLSLVLGGAEMTMRELASLYCLLPNQGLLRKLRYGVEAGGGTAQRLLRPEVAYVTLDMLEKQRLSGIDLRYKTGTSNGMRDAWVAGVVGPYVLITWVGNFDNTPNPLLWGAEVALPLTVDLAMALIRQNAQDFKTDLLAEQSTQLKVQKILVCKATGDLDLSLCTDTAEVWFIPGVSPTRSSGILQKILIDTQTGKRACNPLDPLVVEEVWEMWPSEVQKIFAMAGIVKPKVPAFLDECLASQGDELKIISPKAGLSYELRAGQSSLLLRASTAADAEMVYWFVDNEFIGQSAAQSDFIWTKIRPGKVLKVVDDQGRFSQMQLQVRIISGF